jgi:F-type H+/Na+-transporting ATPase subunit alpha
MMLQRLRSEDSDLMDQLAEGNWDDSIEDRLGNSISEAIDDFGPDFDAEGNPIEEGESDRVVTREEREREDDDASGDGATADARRAEAGEDEEVQEAPEQEAAPA